MTARLLPKGAIANKKRKQVRINIAKQALKNLNPKVKFPNRNAIFEYIANAVREHEKFTNTETKKGPCSRSGVYSIPEIRTAVEKFWLAGVLVDDDVDLHETADAAAKKALMDKELEISNLKHELSEKSRFLTQADGTISKLKSYIENQDITGVQKALGDKTKSSEASSNDELEKLVDKLFQIIFKLECWAGNLLDRDEDGALIDISDGEKVIVSARLMKEYHERVPRNKIEG